MAGEYIVKRIGLTIVGIIFLFSFIITEALVDDYSSLFSAATPLNINVKTSGKLSATYDVDCFTFVAPEEGYYTFYGSGEKELRGHLYDGAYLFLRTGEPTNEGRQFLIAAYFQKGERVYLKVDSSVREEQSYSINIIKGNLPFNRILAGINPVTTTIMPNEIKTIRIPLMFYKNNTLLPDVSIAYTHMLQVAAQGLIQGQAAFNTETYELELDIYGVTDAVIRVNIGEDIFCDILVNADYDSGTDPDEGNNSSDPQDNNGTNPGDNGGSGTGTIPGDSTTYREPEIHAGDCNLDNKVDMNDIAALLDAATLSRFTQEQFSIADVTGNGLVDFTDALMILRRVTGAGK